ncbi:MAG: cellulase family glycosylhydrolase [Spirochaetales bacterium]|nr:cellulase family glycosylhydrolase [Spirochaetales bacterium]
MKIKKKRILILLGAIVLLVSPAFAQTWRVNDQGDITLDGQVFRIKGGAWFGLEGRHEPSDDPNNPSGAPMEMYIGNVWWASSNRTYEGDAQEFAQMGINTVRIPLVHQTLDDNDPQGREPFLKNTESVRINGARSALETVIQACDDAGMYVILDIHSCNNYVGWRAGRIDDYPPWTDAERDNYDFTREDYDCSDYGQSQWTADLRELAGLGQSIGCDNVIGIEIFNEPYDYSWSEWRSLIDTAYQAINSVNSDILVFAGGIGAFNNKHTTNAETPNGDPALNPNWGENLYEAGDNPPSMPKERLVYCPHTYGPSVFVQMQFMDPSQPECEGKEGDEAGDMQCNIVIDPAYISQGWEEHFGYLKDLGYAISINEWGGNPDWPDGAEERMQDRWGWLPDKTVDWQWQEALVDYMISKGICDSCYWSINPESGDTGGLFIHAYDPYNNTGGWGTWEGQDSRKLQLLNRLWDNCSTVGTAPPGTATPTPPPGTATPTGTVDTGDTNGDGSVDIIDALQIAQYYVGLDPANFNIGVADTNCDGSVDVIDALLVAQYYVGLINNFC